MNVIISNKYEAMLQGLEIDVIKSLTGEFEVDYIISQFQNFFFQRMVLDITSLKNYKDIKTLQKLTISLDMDKLILLLDDSEEGSSKEYLSNLISMGIYNFTRNLEGIKYLYNNPNSYRDVAEFHMLNTIDDQPIAQTVYTQEVGVRVIGVKNVTSSSGATTLLYMMKKELSKKYKTLVMEIDKSDFLYFNDKTMISVGDSQIGNTIAKNNDKEVILIDINKSAAALSLCHDVIYLVEPSTIKLNKTMMLDSKTFAKLKDKKIVLNKSLLSSRDVLDFEYESRAKVFFNLPPLDEREKTINIVNAFLIKLGFGRITNEESEKKNKLLGLFGK